MSNNPSFSIELAKTESKLLDQLRSMLAVAVNDDDNNNNNNNNKNNRDECFFLSNIISSSCLLSMPALFRRGFLNYFEAFLFFASSFLTFHSSRYLLTTSVRLF